MTSRVSGHLVFLDTSAWEKFPPGSFIAACFSQSVMRVTVRGRVGCAQAAATNLLSTASVK